MKTSRFLLVLLLLLTAAFPAAAEEIDLPELTGFFRSGPRPITEMTVPLDLTRYHTIDSVRFRVTGQWSSGLFSWDGEQYVLDGTVDIRFDELSLNYPSAYAVIEEGAFDTLLDTFHVSWDQTLEDWTFLTETPTMVVFFICPLHTVTTPLIYPTAQIESVTLFVDGAVPNERTTWGALKNLYR